MLTRWRPDMNLLTVESLRNIDQFAKQIGFVAELPAEIRHAKFCLTRWRLDPSLHATAPRSSCRYCCSGGRSVGWFGLSLSSDRGQVRFLSQAKLDTL
jgi:hypothetical protein